jgi:NADH-quinone oxidoreductase subunit L
MVIHAFFKSTLFLRSGSLISSLSGGQDSRFYGRFRWGSRSLRFFFVRCLSLAGFPFVVGFYSKDFIILSLGDKGGIFYSIFIFCCMITVIYAFRLMKMGYIHETKGFQSYYNTEIQNFYQPVFVLFFVCWRTGFLFI